MWVGESNKSEWNIIWAVNAGCQAKTWKHQSAYITGRGQIFPVSYKIALN